MASECVFNAAVHGRARRAIIGLGYGSGVLALCVADDGRGKLKTLRKIIRGAVPGTGGGYHLGLTDIAARAEEMGWSLRADRSDLGGIAIRVSLPAPAADTDQERPMDEIRVAIIDDHAIVRQGLRAMIDREPDLQVVGEAPSARLAPAMLDRARPQRRAPRSQADHGQRVRRPRSVRHDNPALPGHPGARAD